jgi:multicomponent Na+:H+ antiporter subunit D
VSTASLLPLAVVIPISGATAAPLLGRVHRHLPLIACAASMLGAAGILFTVAPRVLRGHGRVVSHFLGHWGPVDGHALGVALAADPFGLAFALITTLLGTLLLVSALSELGELGPRELGWFACLFQLLLAALIGSALTADMINLFVWFEVAALASYGLTGFFLERPIALEAAFKIVVLTSVAGFLIFIGAALVYADHGALNFAQVHRALPGHLAAPDLLALALLTAGFATKAGLIPFHGWLPDAHTAAPGSVSALFSALMVDLGIIGLARITLQVFGGNAQHAALGLLTVLGVVSAIVGAMLALAQDDLKRLLAWDTVSQMGVLVVGFSSATATGVAGAAYHMVNHALFKGLMFLCAGAIVHSTGETSMSGMGGLVRRRPLLTVGFTVAVLAIAGIPPMNGYASLGLIHDGVHHHTVVYGALLLAQVITIAALARAAYLTFYRPRPEPYAHLEPLRPGMRTTLILLGAACVAFGTVPGLLIVHFAAPAASVLLRPDSYAAGVLSGQADVPALSVSFSYGDVAHLLTTLVTAGLGAAIAVGYLRIREPRPIGWLRAVHTGSVNDYAAMAAAGLLVSAAVLVA